LKRLADKAADLHRAYCIRNHLLAIHARENHSYVRPRFRGFSGNFAAGGSRNGHIKEDHIDLDPLRSKKLYRGRSIGCFEHLEARLPVFAEAQVNPSRAWAGLYEVTPDHHPILGPVCGLPGFFLANGFSGHGVMHSPATGKILADLVLKGATDLIDVSEFALDRFAGGRLVNEMMVL
jgi:glycine/D-amino acid oxidase-like deaminating enzyme